MCWGEVSEVVVVEHGKRSHRMRFTGRTGRGEVALLRLGI